MVNSLPFLISDCLTEVNIDYMGRDVSSTRQPTAESCRASCKSKRGKYFTLDSGKKRCYCKYSNKGRRQLNDHISGETACKSSTCMTSTTQARTSTRATSRSVSRTHVFLLSVDCQWGQWGRWASCTKTCGGGTQISTRRIKRQAQNGGRDCVERKTKTQQCNKNSCPGMT